MYSRSLSTPVDAEVLARELVRRGLSKVELARRAGLAPQTLSAAFSGQALAAATISAIAKALAKAPIIEGVDALLGAEGAAA